MTCPSRFGTDLPAFVCASAGGNLSTFEMVWVAVLVLILITVLIVAGKDRGKD